MEWQVIVASVLPAPFILFPVAYAWYLTGSGTYSLLFGKAEEKRGEAVKRLSCSVDTDCPPGYICVNGVCVPSSQL